MQINDLPPVSDLIVKTNDAFYMTRALRPITRFHTFGYIEAVHGAKRSIRLLLTKPTAGSVEWDCSNPFDIANEISRLTEEARYDPPGKPQPSSVKGWEIRQVEIDGAPAILIWTAWVEM